MSAAVECQDPGVDRIISEARGDIVRPIQMHALRYRSCSTFAAMSGYRLTR